MGFIFLGGMEEGGQAERWGAHTQPSLYIGAAGAGCDTGNAGGPAAAVLAAAAPCMATDGTRWCVV